jgi:hypothetical protein
MISKSAKITPLIRVMGIFDLNEVMDHIVEVALRVDFVGRVHEGTNESWTHNLLYDEIYLVVANAFFCYTVHIYSLNELCLSLARGRLALFGSAEVAFDLSTDRMLVQFLLLDPIFVQKVLKP